MLLLKQAWVQLTFRQVLRHHAALLLSLTLYTAQVWLSLHCLFSACVSPFAASMHLTS